MCCVIHLVSIFWFDDNKTIYITIASCNNYLNAFYYNWHTRFCDMVIKKKIQKFYKKYCWVTFVMEINCKKKMKCVLLPNNLLFTYYKYWNVVYICFLHLYTKTNIYVLLGIIKRICRSKNVLEKYLQVNCFKVTFPELNTLVLKKRISSRSFSHILRNFKFIFF